MKKFTVFALAVCVCVVVFPGCTAREIYELLADNYVVGAIEGDTFESEWLGLRFTAPEGFVMEETAQQYIDLAEVAVVSEMTAMLPDAIASATLVAERLLSSNINIEQYVEAAFGQLEDEIGWDVAFSDDIAEIEFAGETWYTYTADIHAFDMDFSYRYLARIFGNRMALIAIYSLAGEEDNIDLLMAAFEAY